MATLKVLHEVGPDSSFFEMILNLEVALFERVFQSQKESGKKEFNFHLGRTRYYGRIWRVPATEEGRRLLFRKWILQVLENNLEKTHIRLPEEWDPHPACCGH